MTIAEVSKKYEMSPDTLRYYERIGLIPQVPRNKSGIRDYDENSCRWIELMKCMRKAGVQIEALIEYVSLFQQGDSTVNARKMLLIEQRDQLLARMEEMQKSLDRLNQKIDRYEQGLMQAEKSCTDSAIPGRRNICFFPAALIHRGPYPHFYTGYQNPCPHQGRVQYLCWRLYSSWKNDSCRSVSGKKQAVLLLLLSIPYH